MIVCASHTPITVHIYYYCVRPCASYIVARGAWVNLNDGLTHLEQTKQSKMFAQAFRVEHQNTKQYDLDKLSEERIAAIYFCKF